MSTFANDTEAAWVSNKGRTAMKCSPEYLVRITKGLPGEDGACRLVPHASLVPLR